MIARIRKLNNDDLPLIRSIDNDNAKILAEEMESSTDNSYIGYGIFLDLDILVGFCALTDAEDYSIYKYYNKDNSNKAISEFYILNNYNKITSLYCDLLDFVLNDKLNKESYIYFDNNIDLEPIYYEHLGFTLIDDGILVRIPDNSINLEEEI